MSEFDADLYGDLYGGVEGDNEFAVPISPEPTKKDASKPEDDLQNVTTAVTTTAPAANGSSATPAPARTAFSPPAPVANTVTAAPIPSPQPISPSFDEPQQVPTYTSPTPSSYAAYQQTYQPQQVQTYQSRQYDYDGYGGGAGDAEDARPISSLGGYTERSVRPSEMKEEGKMFIGGLNWDTTDEGLKNYFTQFGKVEACTIMRDATGRSRCFAFLTFEEPASVNAVMVKEHVLDGKIIDPKRAIPRQEHARAQKLFIGGLAPSVTSESMREFFSQYGKVIDSTVMVDRETGRSKGFGFVSFEDASIDHILGFGKVEIDGKMIDIKLAQPRSAREGPYSSSRDSYQSDYPSGTSQTSTTPSAASTSATGAPQSSTPFDPQALATLYTRMFQQFGMGMMNPAMMGMGMCMGGMGGMGMGGMGMNPMMAAAAAAGMGRGGAAAAAAGARGGAPAVSAASSGETSGYASGDGGREGSEGASRRGRGGGPINAPRGPRGGYGSDRGGGVGPQRSGGRGHSYHPYSR